MSRDEIIRMAREATEHLSDADNVRLQGIVLLALDTGAAAERERCKDVCTPYVNSANDAVALTALNILDAIRARGQK